jgi:hypothetical protein
MFTFEEHPLRFERYWVPTWVSAGIYYYEGENTRRSKIGGNFLLEREGKSGLLRPPKKKPISGNSLSKLPNSLNIFGDFLQDEFPKYNIVANDISVNDLEKVLKRYPYINTLTIKMIFTQTTSPVRDLELGKFAKLYMKLRNKLGNRLKWGLGDGMFRRGSPEWRLAEILGEDGN